jgi:hemerythrin superfamily protein
MNKYTATRLKEWTSQLEHLIPTQVWPSSDLVRALRRDHDELRLLLEVLKSDKAIGTRRHAYKKFVPLLTAHARAEEKAVYETTAKLKAMRKKTLEGFVEHEVCDLMVAKISKIRSAEKWTAAVQVLAELVEHHLDEEERDLFPKLDQLLSTSNKLSVEALFLQLRDDPSLLNAPAELKH